MKIGEGRQHVVNTEWAVRTMSACGKGLSSIPTNRMHYDLMSLSTDQLKDACLVCLRRLNTPESWARARWVEHGRIHGEWPVNPDGTPQLMTGVP